MKISLVTIHDNCNIGTFLQAAALNEEITALGHEMELVDYSRKHSNMWHDIRHAYELGHRSLPRRVYSGIIAGVSWIGGRRNMLRFLKQRLPYSRRYASFDELVAAPPKSDVFLTGSDQVWNSKYNRGIDKTFFLDFAPQGKPRIAYGASFGMDEIPSDEVEATRELLGRYKAVSARESSAKALLDSLGRTDSVHVLDPTLLLDRARWSSLADSSRIDTSKPYLLFYCINPVKLQESLRIARVIARKRGLKIVFISAILQARHPEGADVVHNFCSPEDFLKLFRDASFAVVSSFHGTAFAINMNRQFVTIEPEKFATRVTGILDLCGLRSRMISEETLGDADLPEIDYGPVNQILDAERARSRDFLRRAIG